MTDPPSPKGVLSGIGGVFSGTAMVLKPDGTAVDVVGEGGEAAAQRHKPDSQTRPPEQTERRRWQRGADTGAGGSSRHRRRTSGRKRDDDGGSGVGAGNRRIGARNPTVTGTDRRGVGVFGRRDTGESGPHRGRVGAPRRAGRSIRLLVEIPLENALEHRDRSSPRVRLAVHDGDERVRIAVTDDGPGMPERERAVIREEETPLFHGTGVGLWTLDWLVTRLGGGMTTAEDEGRGTTVTLVLPRH